MTTDTKQVPVKNTLFTGQSVSIDLDRSRMPGRLSPRSHYRLDSIVTLQVRVESASPCPVV